MTTEPIKTRLVFVGLCTLEGNKPGELWATEARALEHPNDADKVRRLASPFAKDKRSFTAGAVYEAPAVVDEEGVVRRITRDFQYRAMLDTPAVAALQLEDKGLRAAEDAKREEAKAKRNPAYASIVRDLALIVAAAPMQRQERVIAGIMAEVRREALEIWRKGR